MIWEPSTPFKHTRHTSLNLFFSQEKKYFYYFVPFVLCSGRNYIIRSKLSREGTPSLAMTPLEVMRVYIHKHRIWISLQLNEWVSELDEWAVWISECMNMNRLLNEWMMAWLWASANQRAVRHKSEEAEKEKKPTKKTETYNNKTLNNRDPSRWLILTHL